MARRLYLRLFLFSIALTVLTGWPVWRQAAEPESWIRITTSNFTLIGNADEKDMSRVAWRLEQFRAAVLRLLQGRPGHSNPITVIVFRNEAGYRNYRPLYQGQPTTVTGYFLASDDKSYITLAHNSRDTDPYAVIFHEYVHLLTNNFQRKLPTWINEGLAEYFSNFKVSRGEDRVRIGLPIRSHIQLMRECKLMPLEQLVAIDESSPAYNELDKKRIFYAQSWALVHYLLLGNGGKRQGQFLGFLENLSPGPDSEAQFRAAMSVDLAEIETELAFYVDRSQYPSEEVQLGGKLAFDESMKTVRLPPAEVESYLGDLLWRIKRIDEAEKHFARAFEFDPDSAFAHKTLGTLYFRQQRYGEAIEQFERAIALEPDDYLSQYYYGTALQWVQVDESRYVSDFSAESIPKMQHALERAIELNPNFAGSYKQLAFMNLALNKNLDEAVTLLRKSLALEPDREDYVYTLAQVYVRQKKYTEARPLLDRIREMKLKSEVYDNAVRLLSVIDSLEERMAQLKAEAEAKAGPASNGAPQPAPRPEPGKRFVGDQLRGMLTKIDCNDDGTTLSVRSDGRFFRFYSPKTNSLIFVRYTPEIPIEITCGAPMSDKPVIITYRKSTNGKSRFEGEPIGVEFLKKTDN